MAGQSNSLDTIHGAILVNKPAGISSFGVIEALQRQLTEKHGIRRRDLPKLGHGGTLDPFATGLLIVCVGRGVKLARYFLGSNKTYEGIIRFGETTVPGDPTAEISEKSDHLPSSREEVQEFATKLTLQPYLQTPPMHSAKKKNGKALYELARQGIEVEREPKLCQLYSFDILSFEMGADGKPRSKFRVVCSSGTYIRSLSQDLGKMLGTVAMLDTLHRTGSGELILDQALSLDELGQATQEGKNWDQLKAFVPFNRMLDGYPRAEATADEALALIQGRQGVLPQILSRATGISSTSQTTPTLAGAKLPGGEAPVEEQVAIYSGETLVAVACLAEGQWGLERVFTSEVADQKP